MKPEEVIKYCTIKAIDEELTKNIAVKRYLKQIESRINETLTANREEIIKAIALGCPIILYPDGYLKILERGTEPPIYTEDKKK